jgi:WD40 repeat protein
VKMLAVGTNRGTIILANSRGDKREYNSDGRSGKVFCVALSPEGRTLASGSQDGSLQLWDVMSGEIVRSLRGSSAQGREASEKDLQASRMGSVQQHCAPCRSVAWCPCSRLLASGGDDGQVFIWDTEAPSSIPLNAFWGDRAGVRSVAFAPDGSGRVASGGGRGSIMLFNRESGREWARLDAHADQVLPRDD